MFRNDLKFGYAPVAGIALLILVGALGAGGHWTAQPALNGEWIVQQAREAPQPDDCARSLTSVVEHSMSIYQRGADLQIVFNDPTRATLTGKLENGRIWGAGSRTAAPANCGDRGATVGGGHGRHIRPAVFAGAGFV
jgi:hypothetical protein